MKKFLPPFAHSYGGLNPGPLVLIVGGTHGNEPMGVEIIQVLKEELKNQAIMGEIILMIGNPKAVEHKVRALDCDLNRLFGAKLKTLSEKPFQKRLKEEARALEISPLLRGVDYLLDIHSTLKPSIPFLYMENTPAHRKITQGFSVPYRISPLPTFHNEAFRSCMDNFVDAHGGIGITYETGWNKDHFNFEKALSNVRIFLKALGTAFHDLESDALPSAHQPLFIYKEVIAQSDSFIFKKEVHNFSFIKEGDCIGQDGDRRILAEQDSYLIFPKIEIKKGKTATYLARTFDH